MAWPTTFVPQQTQLVRLACMAASRIETDTKKTDLTTNLCAGHSGNNAIWSIHIEENNSFAD
jgi:hypothetical protein